MGIPGSEMAAIYLIGIPVVAAWRGSLYKSHPTTVLTSLETTWEQCGFEAITSIEVFKILAEATITIWILSITLFQLQCHIGVLKRTVSHHC